MDFSYIAALILGLFSSVHCLGMCGGIMGALTYSLPPETRAKRYRLFAFLLLYSLGRITSYFLAGVILGSAGKSVYTLLTPEAGHFGLQLIAALMMCAIGLYLAGWFPKFAYIERIGIPIWKRLEPLGRKLLPVKSPLQAMFYGLVWGWLPCGLVYSALLLTITAGGPIEGGLFMLSFGLGTMPAVVGVGIVAEKVLRLSRLPRIRQIAGVSLILLALVGVLFADQLHKMIPFSDQVAMECTDEQL